MMDAQLRDVHERGEPIAALWASEETIYGRFGYGIASWAGSLTVQHEWDAFAGPLEPVGTTRFVDARRGAQAVPGRVRGGAARAPGHDVRGTTCGGRNATCAWRRTRRTRRAVSSCSRLDGEPQAYAIYRTRFSFEEGLPASRLIVREALGATPAATAAIWRFLLDVDWMSVVEVSLAPPDHPLFLLLALPRRARYRMGDGLWVRLVDLPAALSGRAYGEGGPARARGTRRGLRVERRTLEARRRRVRAHRRRARPRARRLRARLRLSRRGLVHPAAPGAPRGGAAAREQLRAPTHCSRGTRSPGARRSSRRFEHFRIALRTVHLNG